MGATTKREYSATKSRLTIVKTRTSAKPDIIDEKFNPSFILYLPEKFIREVISIDSIKNLIIHMAINCGTPSKLKSPTTKFTTKYPIIRYGMASENAFVATERNCTILNVGSERILWLIRLLIIMQQKPRYIYNAARYIIKLAILKESDCTVRLYIR